MRVVIVGPGRIGAGFLAPLFSSAGWHVTFAAASLRGLDRLDAASSYVVETAPAPPSIDAPTPDSHTAVISGWSAVVTGTAAFIEAVAEADLVCCSVGVRNALDVAVPLAEALSWRAVRRPLDVWSIENSLVAPELATRIERLLPADRPRCPFGVLSGVATVAVASGSFQQAPVRFIRDESSRLVIDRTAATTPMPDLPDVVSTRDVQAAMAAKLHVFNAGHAITAYLGALAGHATIDEAVRDARLRPVIAGAMLESQQLLVDRDGDGDVYGPVAEALRRFANPALADPIDRVAKDPLRKLDRHDRLIAPLSAIVEASGAVPAYFVAGVAAALMYRDPADPSAVELDLRLAGHGIWAVLRDVCGLQPDSSVAAEIVHRYHRFSRHESGFRVPPIRSEALPPATSRTSLPLGGVR